MDARKFLLGVTAAAGLLAVSVVNASAAIVCVGPVCWHTQAVVIGAATAGWNGR
jgi:hypothetical protein